MLGLLALQPGQTWDCESSELVSVVEVSQVCSDGLIRRILGKWGRDSRGSRCGVGMRTRVVTGFAAWASRDSRIRGCRGPTHPTTFWMRFFLSVFSLCL